LGRGGNRPLHGNCRKDAEKVAGVFHKMSNIGEPPPIRDVNHEGVSPNWYLFQAKVIL
jgi:hypothetical protein